MPCDDLDSGLTRSNRPAGGLGRSARPAGALTAADHPQSGNFCRSYTFAPPVVPQSSYMITFAGDYIQTFAGDYVTTF